MATETLLEAYEKERGLAPRTVANWAVSRNRVKSAPAEITDLDVMTIAHFDGQRAASAASEARVKALQPTNAPAAPIVAAPADALGMSDRVDEAMATIEVLLDVLGLSKAALLKRKGMSLEEQAKAFPMGATPLAFAVDMNEKNKARNARLAALEAEVAVLKAAAPTTPDSMVKMSTLELRVRDLEAKPTLKYLGVHEPGKAYAAESAVTKNGCIWIARQATSAMPGQDSAWQLAVRSGRDGR